MADKLATAFVENTTPSITEGFLLFDSATGERFRLTVDQFFKRFGITTEAGIELMGLTENALKITGKINVADGVEIVNAAPYDRNIQLGSLIQILANKSSGTDLYIGVNTYFNAGFKAITTGVASRVSILDTVVSVAYAPSVAANEAQVFEDRLSIDLATGQIRIASLEGAGSRTVVADANGTLSAPV